MATIPLNQIKGHTMTHTKLLEIFETLDSDIAKAIDNIEGEMALYDIGDSEDDMEAAQDMLDSLEAIRGVINA